MAGVACDQGRNRLDLADGHFMKKKTNDAISSLDFALSQLATDKKREDEFSVDEFIQALAEEGEIITVSSAVSRINGLITKGLLTKRKARFGGRTINLFSKA
jgi:hypothetical protein